MKHLSVETIYSNCGLVAATEGLFGDAISKIKGFITGRKKFTLDGIVGEEKDYNVVREKFFDQVLQTIEHTFGDPEWIKDVEFNSGNVSNSVFWMIKTHVGKHDPSKLTVEANELWKTIEEFKRTEKPHIELRLKLFKDHLKIKDEDELEDWWEKVKKPLMKNFTDRFKAKHLKFHGFEEEGAFYLSSEKKPEYGSLWWVSNNSTTLPAVTRENYKVYVQAIVDLIEHVRKNKPEKVAKELHVPYFESLSETWDDAGEPAWSEMSDYLSSSQSFTELSEFYYTHDSHICYQITALCVLLQKSVKQ